MDIPTKDEVALAKAKAAERDTEILIAYLSAALKKGETKISLTRALHAEEALMAALRPFNNAGWKTSIATSDSNRKYEVTFE